MQKVLYKKELYSVSDLIGKEVTDYIAVGGIETFESHDGFDIISFDWHNIADPGADASEIVIYLDRENLFLFCADESGYRMAQSCFRQANANSRALYDFFSRMMAGDMAHLETLERNIYAIEDDLMERTDRADIMEILNVRYELFDLKCYYQQLVSIFECFEENDNRLLTEKSLRWFSILENRADRFFDRTVSLREIVSQVREAYQSQIDIEQNRLMRVFTVVTTVFLPLSLLVGWYGMNFRYMPELEWKYSYPVFIAVCLGIASALLLLFRKKKWF